MIVTMVTCATFIIVVIIYLINLDQFEKHLIDLGEFENSLELQAPW